MGREHWAPSLSAGTSHLPFVVEDRHARSTGGDTTTAQREPPSPPHQQRRQRVASLCVCACVLVCVCTPLLLGHRRALPNALLDLLTPCALPFCLPPMLFVLPGRRSAANPFLFLLPSFWGDSWQPCGDWGGCGTLAQAVDGVDWGKVAKGGGLGSESAWTGRSPFFLSLSLGLRG